MFGFSLIILLSFFGNFLHSEELDDVFNILVSSKDNDYIQFKEAFIRDSTDLRRLLKTAKPQTWEENLLFYILTGYLDKSEIFKVALKKQIVLGYNSRNRIESVKANGKKIAGFFKETPALLIEKIWKENVLFNSSDIPSDVIDSSIIYALGILREERALPLLHYKLHQEPISQIQTMAVCSAVGQINKSDSLECLIKELNSKDEVKTNYISELLLNKYIEIDFRDEFTKCIDSYAPKNQKAYWRRIFKKYTDNTSPFYYDRILSSYYDKTAPLSEQELATLFEILEFSKSAQVSPTELCKYLLIKWNDRRLLERLAQIVYDKNDNIQKLHPKIARSIRHTIINVFKNINMNWGDDLIDKFGEISKDLEDAGAVLGKERAIGDFYKKVNIIKNSKVPSLPELPSGTTDGIRDYLKMEAEIKSLSLAKEIKLLIDIRVKDVEIVEEMRNQLSTSKNRETIKWCLKYFALIVPEQGMPFFKKYIFSEKTSQYSEAINGLLNLSEKGEAQEFLKGFLASTSRKDAEDKIDLIVSGIIDNDIKGFGGSLYECLCQNKILLKYPYRKYREVVNTIVAETGKDKVEDYLIDRISNDDITSNDFNEIGNILIDIKSDKLADVAMKKLGSGKSKVKWIALKQLTEMNDKRVIPVIQKIVQDTMDRHELAVGLISLIRLGVKGREDDLLKMVNGTGKLPDIVGTELLFLDWEFIECYFNSIDFEQDYSHVSKENIQNIEEILFKRAKELRDDFVRYLDQRINTEEYRVTNYLAIRCLMEATPSKESLEVLKRFYDRFPKLDRKTVKAYSNLRKQVAEYLIKHTGGHYKYTVLIKK